MYHAAIHPSELDLRQAAGAVALAHGWRRLAAHAVLPTQDADFISALAETITGSDAVTLFQSEHDGRVEAMIALCRAHGPAARWRQPGAMELGEPGDALCRDRAAGARLAQVLVATGRPLDFGRMLATSPLVAALRESMKGRGWVWSRPAAPCPYILLDAGWREPESRFSSRRRSDFRRAARRAAEFGEVTCATIASTPGEFDALFDEAAAVEARSWKRAAGTAIACDPAKEAFFRRYFRAACERGEMRFAFLRIDGQAAAMHMAVEQAGRHWLFKIGYDEAFARCSPGTLLMLHALRDAAERGLAAFELLGNAEDWIAEFWTRESHPCVRVRTYPFTAAGLAAIAEDGLAWMRGRLTRGMA